MQGAQPEVFRALRKTKKDPHGKFLDTRKILNGKFNPKMDTITAFFPKNRVLFSIFKNGQGRPSLLPS